MSRIYSGWALTGAVPIISLTDKDEHKKRPGYVSMQSLIEIMKKRSFEFELQIDDDYRRSKENQKQRFFFTLIQETNFKINKFFRNITKDKKKHNKILNIKGRDFKIQNYYEGISRFDFKDLCDQNLGAEII